MIDPNEPLSLTEKQVFGANARRHPVLGFVIELGLGSLPVDDQAKNFIRDVEYYEGATAAEALRIKMKAAAARLHVK